MKKLLKINIALLIIIVLFLGFSYVKAESATFEDSLKRVITVGTVIEANDGFTYARGQYLKKDAVFASSSVSEKVGEKEYTIFNYSVEDKKYTFNIDINSMKERISGSSLEEGGQLVYEDEISTEMLFQILESCYIAVANYETTDLSTAYTYFAQQLDETARESKASITNDVFSYVLNFDESSEIKEAYLIVNADKMKEFNIDSGKKIYTVKYRDDEEFAKIDISKFSVDDLGSERYTGTAKEPKTSKVGDLEEGRDYVVTYKDNINPGQAYLIITGIGNYKGTIIKPFRILPAKVQNVKTKSQTDKTITLKWDKSGGGVTGYRIYMYNSKTKKYDKRLADTTKTTYTIEKLTPGTTYKFQVTAYKLIGTKTYEGLYSKTLTTTTKTKKPTLSKVTAGKKKATVTFKNVSGASGYQIQYSTNKNFKKNNKTLTVSKNKKSKTISKLTTKKKYYFRIRAYRTVDGKKVYSSYSLVKNVKIK